MEPLPLVHAQYIKPFIAPPTARRFGLNVAMSRDGAPLARAVSDSGAAYLFRRTNGTWAQRAYIKAFDVDEGDGFGRSVALSADGSRAVIGVLYEGSGALGVGGDWSDESAPGRGAVYIYDF